MPSQKFFQNSRSEAMPAPVGPGLLAQGPSVAAQLVNGVGACQGAKFSAPATRNTAAQFKDKAD